MSQHNALKQPALGTASFSLHYKRTCGFELRKEMGRRERQRWKEEREGGIYLRAERRSA